MNKHSAEYSRYLKSDEWAAKRAERLLLDDNKCALCDRPNGTRKDGVTPILQIHHISYQRLGNEPMEDLISVCARCHKLLHRYYNRCRSWEDKANLYEH